jgi:hypothetical protein
MGRADVIKIHALLLLTFAFPASACEYPDQGNMPLRRAVAKVKSLPGIEALAKEMHDKGEVVQYALFLEEAIQEGKRCYWRIEVNAGGKTWRSFYVTPDGRHLRPAGGPPAARAPR